MGYDVGKQAENKIFASEVRTGVLFVRWAVV